jgi:hypothetical protein
VELFLSRASLRFVALAGVFTLIPAGVRHVRGDTMAARASSWSVQASRVDATYEYRVVGQLRFLFLWLTASDVGGARVTFRQRVDTRSISLLIGSDPERAPRRINEWGYVREEVAAASASVFGVRTTTDGDSAQDAEDHRTRTGAAAEYGVLCAGIQPEWSTSSTTTIRTSRDLTYRNTDQLLDQLERVSQFIVRVVRRPPDTLPGFLTALDRLTRRAAGADRGQEGQAAAIGFVYKDGVYDLRASRTESVAELRTRSRVFRNLLRSDITIRNRQTGAVAAFSITYGTTNSLAGVIVAARYQPRWWFRIELELDGEVEAPPDPADDPAIDQRVQALCARALGR